MEFDLRTHLSRILHIFLVLLLMLIVGIVCLRLIGMTKLGTIYTRYADPGPSWATQRPNQRRKVQQRINAMGGWNTLRQVSDQFCRDHPSRFDWNRGMGNKEALPEALAALAPMRVSINAHPEVVYPVSAQIVEIKFFGGASTGAAGVPDYEIWVVCGKARGYIPDVSHYRSAITTGVANRIEEGIFEVY